MIVIQKPFSHTGNQGLNYEELSELQYSNKTVILLLVKPPGIKHLCLPINKLKNTQTGKKQIDH